MSTITTVNPATEKEIRTYDVMTEMEQLANTLRLRENLECCLICLSPVIRKRL